MKISTLKEIVSIFFILNILSLLSILYVDNGLFIFIHHYLLLIMRFSIVSTVKAVFESNYFLYSVCTLILSSLLFRRNKRKISFHLVLYWSICLLLIVLMKGAVKALFGRCAPLDSTSIECKNFYFSHGFNFFKNLPSYSGCFPSGHCFIITFCCVWIGLENIKIYSLCALVIPIFTSLTLVLLCYHYLSDCIFGISLGYISGIASIKLWLKLGV